MILLGSTGSIGQNTLDLAKAYNLEVEVLVAGKNITLLNQQIKDFSPSIVVIADQNDYDKLHPNGAKVLFGKKGILEALDIASSNLVINALVGFAGLEPTYHTLQSNKTLALANKESLVTAGWLMDCSKIIPIDSEHFSLWHLSQNQTFNHLYITASGGAFRDTPLEEIPLQKVQQALNHPNWKMGAKITIDSASMVNKLFEVLEARWLFDTHKIDALIERRSIIHALVEFADGSLSAHYAKPDMKLAISYALSPTLAKSQSVISKLSLQDFSSITLEPICTQRYPLWKLKDELLQNPKLGLILNASNEVAIQAFMEEKITFGGIEKIIFEALEHFHTLPTLNTLEDIKAFNEEIRSFFKNI